MLNFLFSLVRHEIPGKKSHENSPVRNANASYNVLRLLEIDTIKWLLHTSLRDAQSIALLIGKSTDSENVDNSYKVDVENLMESYNVIENILYALLRAKGEINDLFHIAEFMISSAPARHDTKKDILKYFNSAKLFELYGSKFYRCICYCQFETEQSVHLQQDQALLELICS